MNFKHTALAALAILGLAAGQSAGATTVTSNVNETTGGYAPLSTFWRAESFTVANDQNYTLNGVQAKLYAAPDANFFADIYAGTSSTVGSLLEQLSIGSFASSLLSLNSTGLGLTAGGTYWLVLGETSGGGTNYWESTSSANQTGLTGWSIGDTNRLTFNSGASWGSYAYAQQMSIDASPAESVPAPATLTLLGIAGLGLLRRRQSS